MGDDNRNSWEKPAHKVVVSDFYIGKYPVTQKQWIELMGSNLSYFEGCDDCPVEKVSWDDVQKFIKKQNQKTGKTFRLPTEAEWEYAAGGGESAVRTKWAGTSNESELADYAWFDKNSDIKTHPVGAKKPNNLGVYDMSGNVWEWCNDWFSEKYYDECKSKETVENPQGLKSGSIRVIRGGSWYSIAQYCRSAHRDSGTPDGRSYYLGFRLALVP